MGGAAPLQLLPPPTTVIPDSHSSDLVFNDLPRTIYITKALASRRDTEGLTLIPPSGRDFTETFRNDLIDITGDAAWSLEEVTTLPETGIQLDYTNHAQDFATYENGSPTEEAYELQTGNGRARIVGSGARGVWWGTRTLLQQLMLSDFTTVPAGTVRDAPAYATRGFMLDAGRKWYAASFLKELCTYASFFKMNEFHYHASDNFPLNRGRSSDTWRDVYSQFSLRPEEDLEMREGLVDGGGARETLGRGKFAEMQRHCARRGVTLVPEIEAPGHCLAVTKWKPELAFEGKRDLLDLRHPDALATVKRIWAEFLPWFETKEVHIGADEYDPSLADEYITFVNEMAAFIKETSGKRVRIWGTHEPSQTKNLAISRDVVVQHWQYGQSDPVQLQRDGYDIINSEDWWAYMSLKNNHVPILPAPYPQFFDASRVMNFAGREGWQWQPALFNPFNTTEQLEPGARGNRGAIMAAWNDNGPEATTQLEAYYAMRNGMPLVAARSWSGARGPELDPNTINSSIEFLASRAPSQNLDRRTPFKSWTRDPTSTTNNSEVFLGGGSKGMDYTLTLTTTGPFTLTSPDTTLTLDPKTSHLLFTTADDHTYPLRRVAETAGFQPEHPGRIWADDASSSHKPVAIPLDRRVELTVTGDVIGGSRVYVDGVFAGRFEVFVYGGRNQRFSWSQMAFVAPVGTLLYGEGVERITLRSGVVRLSSVGEKGGR